MDKKLLRDEAFSYLKKYGEELYGEGNSIEAKLKNICGKTGQYDVPSELFQKRTKRSNRSLISWRTVKANHLTMKQLDTFE